MKIERQQWIIEQKTHPDGFLVDNPTERFLILHLLHKTLFITWFTKFVDTFKNIGMENHT